MGEITSLGFLAVSHNVVQTIILSDKEASARWAHPTEVKLQLCKTLSSQTCELKKALDRCALLQSCDGRFDDE